MDAKTKALNPESALRDFRLESGFLRGKRLGKMPRGVLKKQLRAGRLSAADKWAVEVYLGRRSR
jgi:hypothetical protein